MSFTNAAETAFLQHFFENADWANVGDATGLRGSTTAGSVYISLHTADPAETGDQTSNEISYTGYARVAVARAGAQWNVSGANCTNANAITFGQRTDAGTGTVTHFGIGSDASGTGNLFMIGTVTPNLVVSQNVTPSFAADQLTVTAE